MQVATPNLSSIFENLASTRRELMQIAAIVYGPMLPSDMAQTYGRYCKAVSRKVDRKVGEVRRELDKLCQKGLLVHPRGYYGDRHCVEPSILDLIHRSALASPNYQAMVHAVFPTDLASISHYELYYYPTTAGSVLRTAFYEGRTDMVATLRAELHLPLTGPRSVRVLSPFSQECYQKLPTALQGMFLADASQGAVCHGECDEAIYECYLAYMQNAEQPSAETCAGLVDWAIARGDLDALKFVDDKTEGCLQEIQGVLAFFAGDMDAAEQQLTAAHQRRSKMLRQRRYALPHLPGLLRALLLLRHNTEAARKAVKSDIAAMARLWPRAFDPTVDALQVIVQEQPQLFPFSTLISWKHESHLSLIVHALGCVWLNNAPLPSNVESYLIAAQEAYARSGLLWVAGQATDLLSVYRTRSAANSRSKRSNGQAARTSPQGRRASSEPSDPSSPSVEQALSCEQTGLPSLVTLIEPLEEWERILDSLCELSQARSGTSDPSSEVASRQLIWLVQVFDSGEVCNITARLRHRLKRGQWGRGRELKLSELYDMRNQPQAHPYLTEQDLRICQCVQYYDPYSTVTSYRGQHGKYTMLLSDVAAQLAGHPLVFREGDQDHPIEIEHGRPQLWITESNGKTGELIHLTLKPPFDPTTPDRVMAVEDGPHRLMLVTYTRDDIDLATRLHNGIAVPATGREKVAHVAQQLSSMVMIQSDVPFSSEHVQQVDADPRPHLHLIPHADGLRVEFFVRPLKTEGPFHRPGEGAVNALVETNGEKRVARRDLAAERKWAMELIEACSAFDIFDQEPSQPFLFDTAGESLEVMLQLQPYMESEAIVVHWPQGERYTKVRSADPRQMSITIKHERDWFAASGKLQLDDDQVLDMMELLERISATNSRFIQLNDGSFLALTEEFRQRLSDLSAYSERRSNDLRFPPIRAVALQDLTETFAVKHDEHWTKCIDRLTDSMKQNPALPKTFKGELRDYQQDGFVWLSRLAHWGMGACLADDMGLGKTIQALALLVDRSKQGPALVVAPTSVTYNWLSESRRFAPTLNVHVFGQCDRERVMQDLGPRDVVITSYGLLHNEVERFQQQSWTTVVLDEAQAIKNMATKRSQAAMSLQSDFRLILTGTPLENHLGELWNLFQFINPGLLGSWKVFQDRFAVPIERDRCADARRRLKKLIQPFILRRTKTQVLQELPPRTEVTIQVELSREEASFYEGLRRVALERLADVSEQDASQHVRVLSEIMRLRRACCHPRLVMPESKVPASKLALFLETVDELLENGHKALVFSQFVDHLTILREALDRRGITYQYLDGRTPARARRDRVNAFQSGEGELFLISLKAGGLGLNLTAADFVLHMDPWWNPAVEDQASDRAHRLGQQRPVTIYRFITTGTIEEQILDLHGTKRDLADSLLEGTDVSGKLTTSELLRLLRG